MLLILSMRNKGLEVFVFIVLAVALLSCNEVASFPSEKYEVLSGDTVDIRYTQYDSLGNIVRQYYVKDSFIHGLYKEFYPNGNVKMEGKWYQGKQVGWSKYYRQNSTIEALRQYVLINDKLNWESNEPYLNQVIRFNEQGDTVKEGSFYMKRYVTGDTIKNGDTYAFKIVLEAHPLKHMSIVLCDYDDLYALLPNGTCDTFGVENFQRAFSPKEYKLGENYIRGKILNYEGYLDTTGHWKTNIATIYFTDRFYVAP